jgi:ABC-2 type transport system permease protein
MFSLVRFKAIAQKEMLELNRNKLFFSMIILAPVVLFLLFVYGFPLDPKDIPIAFVDMDKSPLSRSLIDSFANTSEIFTVKRVVGNYSGIENSFLRGDIRAVLTIPENFQRDLQKASPATLQLLLDATNTNSASLIGNYASGIISDFRYKVLNDYFIKQGFSVSSAAAINLETSGWYNSSFRAENFLLPGIIALIIMFFPPIVGAISLAKEKETGSILNMYCSSVTRAEYLLGKMLPYVVISFIICLSFIAYIVIFCQVPLRGNFLVLIAASFFYVAAAIGTGLLVAVLVNTQIAAILLTSMFTLTPTFLYSGFMVPVSNVDEGSRFMSYAIPSTHYIDLLRKIMVKGVSFNLVQAEFLAIAVICLSLYLICIKLFKKRLG